MTLTVERFPVAVPVPERAAAPSSQLISQGAEALVFALSDSLILKYRPPKPWRLPALDQQLRKRRTTQEARVLERLAGFDVRVPKLKRVDVGEGVIYMELVKGKSLKQATWDAQTSDGSVSGATKAFYEQLGAAVARMHHLNVVHGDLTTSNAMVSDGEIVLIDFGLSSQAANVEDKAVDLYVLERAIQSTHPREAAELVGLLMPAYTATAEELNDKVKQVLDRLENVRRRGRKRTQLG